MDDEIKKLIEASTAENRQLFQETRRHFDVVGERLEHKIALVAEGVVAANERIDRLSNRVDEIDAKFEGKIDSLAADMAREFDNTRSMIKFSHHELDRRVRTLEETVADLQSRVERLESSTH